MQKFILFTTMIILSSCSTTLQDPILNLVGVDKVEIDQDDYKRPELYVENFKFSTNSRSIASVATVQDHDLSNRQLYFLTYYQQYLTLGHILKKKDTIKTCPRFHHVYLEHKDDLEQISGEYADSINFGYVQKNNYLISQYPILSLPYSDSHDLFTVLKGENWQGSQEHFQHALEYYYEIEKKEVSTLCDRGVSPGYYVYENLVQYFKQQSDFHRTSEGLKAILKIPVVANMLILDNLSTAIYATSKRRNFESWLIKRSNLTWFSEYRENLVQKRKVLLSSAKY